MLHRNIDFFSLFYGLPLIAIFISLKFFSILDSNIGKRKNLNSFNIKINLISGKNSTYNFFSKLTFIYIMISLNLLFLSKTYYINNNFSEITITNNTLYIISTIYIIILFIIIFNINIRSSSYKQSLNLIFVITLAILPYIYIYNSLLFLFFFIETINISIFLFILNSLTTLEILNKKKSIESLNSITNFKKFNTNYRYCTFIYYWLSFFFSIFFFLFISIISFKFYFIDVLSLKVFLSELIFYKQNLTLSYDCLTFILLILISVKFGLPPFHLQKITIYKGLPINLSLFYSILVILSYFFIFVNFFYFNPILFNSIKILFKIILIITIPYVLIILYKELNIKAFFGYSSILNISLLFLVLIMN